MKEKIKFEIIEELKELKKRITELKSIEEGTEASGITAGNYLEKLKMQKQILEEIQDGVISAGFDGYITGWNKSAESLTGYKLEEVMGKHFSLFYEKKDRDFLENYMASPEKEILQVEMKKKSGENFYSNLLISTIKDSKGSPEGIICYFSDITEYKKSVDLLERKNLREKELLREVEKLQEEMRQEKELAEEFKKDLSGEVEKLHERVRKEKELAEKLKKDLSRQVEQLKEEVKKEKELSGEEKKDLSRQVEKLREEVKKEKELSGEEKKDLLRQVEKLKEEVNKEKELSEEEKKELSQQVEKLKEEVKKEKELSKEEKKDLSRQVEQLKEEVKKEKEISEEEKKDLSRQVEQLKEEVKKEKELSEEVEKLKEEVKKEKEISEEEKKDLSRQVEKLKEEVKKEKEISGEVEKLREEVKKEKELSGEVEKLREEVKKEKELSEELEKDLLSGVEKLYEELKKEKELIEALKKEKELTEELKSIMEEMKKEIKQRKRSQKTLQENKVTLEIAQKISHLGYWSYNIQNNMYDWSDEMFHILGCSPETGIPSYEDCKKIIHDEDWKKFDRSFKEAVNTGKSYNMDLKIIFPDRSIHYVNARACPQYDKDNKITALFGVMQDITERKYLEEELKKSLDNLNIKNQIAGLFLTVSSENISGKILPAIMKPLKSRYGLFGLIDNRGNLVKTAGYLDLENNVQISDCISVNREIWSDNLKEILLEGKACSSNTLISEGEFQIKRSLSVPLFRSGKPSGILTVANKEDDYKEYDKILLQTIAEIVSPVLNARLESNRLKAELNGLEYQIKKTQKVEADLIQNILLR